MIPTELQRLILMVALAATGYLLVLAWTDDYGEATQRTAIAASPDLGSGTDVSRSAAALGGNSLGSDLPGEELSSGPLSGLDGIPDSDLVDSDVPDTSLVLSPEASVSETPQPSGPESGRLIKVFTDTLEVWLDLRGGDIIRTRLPLYPVSLDQPNEAFTLLDRSGGRTYIAQSGLTGRNGIDKGQQRPLYSAGATEYRVSGSDSKAVVLKTRHNGVDVEKTFLFTGDSYSFDVSYKVVNTSGAPFEANFFGQIKRDRKPPLGETTFTLGPQPYLGAAITTNESRYEKVDFDDLDETPLRETVDGGWVAMLQHYFLSAWVSPGGQTNRIYGDPKRDGTYNVGYVGPAKQIAAGATGEWHSKFYAGPKDQDRLSELAEHLNLTVDYGFLWWMAAPLFKLLTLLQGIVSNWGVAIILLTVVVKAMLYPLSAASFRSMANMRRVAPQLKRLQERYADDRQKLSQEMMALYKKEKVNPLGGCLPMLLQMPVFLSLYWVLFESVELRQAPFFAWIVDLAAMDKFFVLPILMGGSMFVQQMLNPAPVDPMQAKVMKFMPIMFTALFLFFPAGLVLYWLTNNLLSMAQQWLTNKQVEGEANAKASA